MIWMLSEVKIPWSVSLFIRKELFGLGLILEDLTFFRGDNQAAVTRISGNHPNPLDGRAKAVEGCGQEFEMNIDPDPKGPETSGTNSKRINHRVKGSYHSEVTLIEVVKGLRYKVVGDLSRDQLTNVPPLLEGDLGHSGKRLAVRSGERGCVADNKNFGMPGNRAIALHDDSSTAVAGKAERTNKRMGSNSCGPNHIFRGNSVGTDGDPINVHAGYPRIESDFHAEIAEALQSHGRKDLRKLR